MKSYATHVHLYGSVAVLTLCAKPAAGDGATCLERLAHALEGITGSAGSLVLDLDRAPCPAPVDALAAIDVWAAEQAITVVALASSRRCVGRRRSATPALRTAPAGLAPYSALRDAGVEAARVQQLRRDMGVRVLVRQAAGIRQARHQARPLA
ncbi:hypothetical protein ABT084_21005 [Streptomyces sp. NPDC002138]|uniref:hypothetical protein n=1 Tax=Streptomyces sp. NPDC002138 TaxID=3154410 RepID=UPI00331A6ECF